MARTPPPVEAEVERGGVGGGGGEGGRGGGGGGGGGGAASGGPPAVPPGGELPLPLFQSLPPLALLLPAAEPPPPAVEPPPPGDQYSRNLFLKVKKEHDDKRKKEEADRLREEQERQAAEFAPPPLPPPLETLPAELTPLKLSAAAQGVRADAIEQLDASDSPKQAAISLLLHEKKKEPIPTAQSAAGEVVVDAEPKFGVVAATPEPGLPVSLSSTTAVTRCSCNSLSSFAATQCRKPAVLLRRRAAATVGPRSTASRVTRTLSAKGSTFLLCASTACSVLRFQCEGQHVSAACVLPLPVLCCASSAKGNTFLLCFPCLFCFALPLPSLS